MATASDFDADLIYTLRANKTSKLDGNETNDAEQEDESLDNSNLNENKILCVIWKNGKLGAAYYNFDKKLVSYFLQNICFFLIKLD